MYYARGLCGRRHLLANSEGRLWVAPADVVFEAAKLENEGFYDRTGVGLGDKVRFREAGVLSTFDMLVASATPRVVELLSPLFSGGARVVVKAGDLVRGTA
jgi:hypothetical protein